MCYLMTTSRCPSDFLITSWLFTARWSTWPGNHLVRCVAELVGSCIPIHAHRRLPDLKCLWPFLSIWSVAVPLCRLLLPCPSRWHGSLPRHGLWWLTCELHCSSLPWSSGLCTSCERVHFFLVFLDPHIQLPACFFNIRNSDVSGWPVNSWWVCIPRNGLISASD